MNFKYGVYALFVWTMFSGGSSLLLAQSHPTPAQQPTYEEFKSMRYGMFNHIVYRLSITPDQKRSYTNLDDFTANFDVNAYADEIKSFGAEYVIFTVWHKSIYALCPLTSLEKWLPGHTSKRDLVGEIADALNARGIQMILYAHPSDAHDLTASEQALIGYTPRSKGVQPKYNDFINKVYGELATRYGKKPNVLGFWWDSWRGNGGCLDAPRLRATTLAAFPRAIILSNNPSNEIVDFYSAECYFIHKPQDDIEGLPVGGSNQTTIFAGNWWCDNLNSTSHYSAETLFRFTAMDACAPCPGGICWAVSPTVDGKTYTKGVQELMEKLGNYIQEVRPAICKVSTWSDWPIKGGIVFSRAPVYGSTRSRDGRHEYVHIIKPPQGKSVDLDAPLVTPVELFTSATLMENQHPVMITRIGSGLRLTLADEDSWNPLVNIIDLTISHPMEAMEYLPNNPSFNWSSHWEQQSTAHSSRPGEFVTLQFSGTSFTWIGVRGPDHGIAELVLDDKPAIDVDTYEPTRLDSTVCYKVKDLPEGEHTLKITVSSRRNGASNQSWMEIQKIVVLKPVGI